MEDNDGGNDGQLIVDRSSSAAVTAALHIPVVKWMPRGTKAKKKIFQFEIGLPYISYLE